MYRKIQLISRFNLLKNEPVKLKNEVRKVRKEKVGVFRGVLNTVLPQTTAHQENNVCFVGANFNHTSLSWLPKRPYKEKRKEIRRESKLSYKFCKHQLQKRKVRKCWLLYAYD
jgi:hypothetical protein